MKLLVAAALALAGSATANTCPCVSDRLHQPSNWSETEKFSAPH